MAAETNLIKKEDLVRAREIEFVTLFGESIKKLVEALGVTRKIPKQAGYTLKAYKATGTLQPGTVAEGDLIPLSKYQTQAVSYAEIVLKKWRKATSAEAIIENQKKAAVKEAQAEWLKSRPQANAGAYSSMTKEQIMAIPDRNERRMAIAQNQNLFI